MLHFYHDQSQPYPITFDKRPSINDIVIMGGIAKKKNGEDKVLLVSHITKHCIRCQEFVHSPESFPPLQKKDIYHEFTYRKTTNNFTLKKEAGFKYTLYFPPKGCKKSSKQDTKETKDAAKTYECWICAETHSCCDVSQHTLVCGHSLCENCLVKIASKETSTCPYCRHEFQVPETAFPSYIKELKNENKQVRTSLNATRNDLYATRLAYSQILYRPEFRNEYHRPVGHLSQQRR